MNEHGLTNTVRAWLAGQRARGVWAVKLAGGPFQAAGLPDFVACVRGRFAVIELKHPSDASSVQTPLQARIFAKIRDAGGATCVARDRATVVAFIESVLAWSATSDDAPHVADVRPLKRP